MFLSQERIRGPHWAGAGDLAQKTLPFQLGRKERERSQWPQGFLKKLRLLFPKLLLMEQTSQPLATLQPGTTWAMGAGLGGEGGQGFQPRLLPQPHHPPNLLVASDQSLPEALSPPL